jgi:BirA family biotin operon repressor/biotin-[acetyl-CoA-carboxylase] ligase
LNQEKDYIDPDKISRNLNTKTIGKKIVVFESTSSTNDIAGEYAKGADNDGLVVFAESQTAGRGRSGNKWLAGKGDSILCSILLTSVKISGELLSLAAAVAAAEAIGRKAKIKWPNDIILNGKKVAGILLETKKLKSHTAFILGIGINCNQKVSDFPHQLQQTATSIDIETAATTDRITLAKRLLICLEHRLAIAEKNGEKIIEKWNRLSTQLHHRITVVFNSRKFSGTCIGVDPEKGIIVQLDTGAVRMFAAAHSSIDKN